MDRQRFSYIAHRNHQFCSPCSAETFDALLAPLDLQPGDKVIDLGCGTGGMAILLARRFAAQVLGVDLSPRMIDAASRRADAEPGEGTISFQTGDAAEFIADHGPCRMIVASGAGGLVPGAATMAETLRGLAAHLVPGGWLLHGEGYWKKPPSRSYLEALGAAEDELTSHAGNVAAGESAGLVPILAMTASEREWDVYEWTYSTAVESHLAEHPDDPDADAMRTRIRNWRRTYLTEGRETLGFGLYLYRKP